MTDIHHLPMTHSKINKYFSIDDYIGTLITQKEYDKLFNAGKLYNTMCEMTGAQAAKTIKPFYRKHTDKSVYGGMVVADSPEQAERVMKKRGYGEVFLGEARIIKKSKNN